jgi:flagellar biosynthesis chaperone FliJ
MATARSLRRLHGIRETEEHMISSALQSAIHELQQVESAMRFAHERATVERGALASRLQSGSPEDRIAGFEEIAAADRLANALSARIRLAQEKVTQARKQFFQVRVQRQQAQTLLEQSLSRARLEADRRAQMALDEWHRSQLRGNRSNRGRRELESPESEIPVAT